MKRKTLPSFNHELTFGSARPKRRGRALIFLLVLVAVVGASYPLLDELPAFGHFVPQTSQLPPGWQAPDVAFVAEPSPPPIWKVDIEYVVRPNDTLGQIFERLGLDPANLPAILTAPGVGDSFGVLRPGDRLTFTLHNDVLYALNRRLSETRIFEIRRGDAGFAAAVVETPIEVRMVQVQGTITSSRFFGGRPVGLAPDMAHEIAHDIFAWDVDFALDIRAGDRFKVIYEQRYRNGEYLGDGRIVAAELVNDGKAYRAVRYTSPDGMIDGYFTPEGRSVRRALLRTPIDFNRVRANLRADGRETVLHTLPEHLGVDYEAPTGTAVKAAGDGRIRFAGPYGDYGYTVIVEHGGSVSTLYAHLSGFAPHVQANREVRQGDVIGYVGHSGAATASHLHYEYRVDGEPTDPSTVALPPGAPIPAEYRADFETRLSVLLARLEGPGDVVVTALRTD